MIVRLCRGGIHWWLLDCAAGENAITHYLKGIWRYQNNHLDPSSMENLECLFPARLDVQLDFFSWLVLVEVEQRQTAGLLLTLEFNTRSALVAISTSLSNPANVFFQGLG